MSEIVRVGVDLAKRVIPVHAVDTAGKVVTSRVLPRNKFIVWCAQLPSDCVVASCPQMRFVAVKTPAQQGILCVHRLREGLKSDRTACINRIRGLLAEFGLVFPKGPKRLREVLTDVLEDAGNDLRG